MSYRHSSSGKRNAGWTAESNSPLSSAGLHPSNLSVHTLSLYQLYTITEEDGVRSSAVYVPQLPQRGDGARSPRKMRSRDGGRQGEILGRRRDLIRGCRRKEEGRGEADDTRSLNHRHIPHWTGASSSDRTPSALLSRPFSPSRRPSFSFLKVLILVDEQNARKEPLQPDANTHVRSKKHTPTHTHRS